MFNELYEIDVRDKVEQKNGLNYLSWAYAWAEVKKIDENASYEIKQFENNLPYVYDEHTGYMVFTTMTIKGITHSMFLPVMDSANKTMLAYEYTYKVKKKEKDNSVSIIEKTVQPATMFDINKTLMRCLTKNIAMFGLGLKLYQGEDLPLVQTKEDAEKVVVSFGKYAGKTLKEIMEVNENYLEYLREHTTDANIKAGVEILKPLPNEEEQKEWFELHNEMMELVKETHTDPDNMCKAFKVNATSNMTNEQLKIAIKKLKEKLAE